MSGYLVVAHEGPFVNDVLFDDQEQRLLSREAAQRLMDNAKTLPGGAGESYTLVKVALA